MAILTADLLEGMALSQDADGYEATRVFTLEQVGGGGADRLYQALQHPSLPRFGDPHPAIPDLRCTNRTAALAKGSSDTVVATLTYRVPKPQEQPAGEVGGSGGAPVPGVQRIGGTVQQTTTQKDRNGTAITVTATYPADYEDETLRGITETQGGEVDIQVPNLVLSETRNELRNPAGLARGYVGTVNQFGIWGGAARTYLCTRIDGQTTDGGKTFEVAYEFQYNPATWDATAVFRDPKNQRPVVDRNGNGLNRSVRIYPEANFGALGLFAADNTKTTTVVRR